jgi:hypothetical protein
MRCLYIFSDDCLSFFSTVGLLFLLSRFFDFEPEAKIIFGFKDNANLEDLAKSRRFVKHAKYFIQMIDKALGKIYQSTDIGTN